MQIQRVNRSDPEQILFELRNSYSTATLNVGQWCAYDIVTDKDGVGVTKPAGFNRMSIAGVVAQSMQHNQYGLVQAWGYRAGARCLGGSGLNTEAFKVIEVCDGHARTAGGCHVGLCGSGHRE